MAELDLNDFAKQHIFKNYSALREDFIPEQIVHRKTEMEYLASRIFAKPLLGQPPGHLFLLGTTGTGKTLAVKYWIKELEKYIAERGISNTAMYYVNCSTYPSQWHVANHLAMMVDSTAKQGRSIGDYIQTFLDYIDTHYNIFIVILDEADYIFPKPNEKDTIFYCLVRARELGMKNAYPSLLLISNNTRGMETLSQGTKASFGIDWLHFPRYTTPQIKDIIAKRAEEAFFPNVYTSELLDRIADYCGERGGNIRQAISLMKTSGETAEKNKHQTITKEDFEKAKWIYEAKIVMTELMDMTLHEKLVYYSLVLYHSLYHAEDYRVYFDTIYVVYTRLCEQLNKEANQKGQVRNYLNKLMLANLINDQNYKGKKYYYPIIESKTAAELLQGFLDEHKLEADKIKSLLGEQHE